KPVTQPVLIGKPSDGVASGPESGADHGIRSDVVVYVPQPVGVASSPRGPPKKCSFNKLNGNCGFSLNTPVTWPVTGPGVRFPGIFPTPPVAGSSITIYPANNVWNGFSFCAARYTEPCNTPGNAGVSTSTEPIFDASGHEGALAVKSLRLPPCQPICASLHAARPPAAAGFTVNPAGRTTLASRNGGVASVSGS